MKGLPANLRCFFFVGIAAQLSACGKKETATPASAPAPAVAEQSVEIPLAAPTAKAPSPLTPSTTPAAPGERPPVDPVLKRAIERYFGESGRSPESWQDLVTKKYLPAIPLDATGTPLDFKKFLFDMR